MSAWADPEGWVEVEAPFTSTGRPYFLRISHHDSDKITALGPYPNYEAANDAMARLQARESERHGYEISLMFDPADEAHLHV